MRLGDLDWLIRQLETNKANVNPLDYCTKATYAECITMVKAMATIEAEPVRHGLWEHDTCSVCGAEWFDWANMRAFNTNYCPNCGAKMDLGKD